MRILVETVGSAGDVFPFVGLGRELAARGHDVRLFANDAFQATVEAAGLAFRSTGTAEKFEELVRHPDLWHPRKGPRVVLEGGVYPNLVRSAHAIEAEIVPGDTVLVGGTLGFASRVVRERVRVPLATIHLAPSAYWSVHRAPRFPGLPLGDGSPRFWKRALLGLARRLVDWQAGPGLDAVRQELGLAPVRHVLDAWIHSPDVGVALFPDWFGPPQPDWPRNVRCTGFPLFDDAALRPVDPALEAWLAEGTPTVLFTAGSANVHVAEFARVCVEASQRAGCRALVVSRAGEAMPSPMPAHARHESYVPFSRVLPHVAALVSHAGIGTCAQACAAGIPHLAMPISFDQFDNASRLVDLEIGAVLPASKFSVPRAVKVLASVLADDAMAARARDIANLVRTDDGLARAATLIEGAARVPNATRA